MFVLLHKCRTFTFFNFKGIYCLNTHFKMYNLENLELYMTKVELTINKKKLSNAETNKNYHPQFYLI